MDPLAGLQATTKDDDTFLKVEKGWLFVLNAGQDFVVILLRWGFGLFGW